MIAAVGFVHAVIWAVVMGGFVLIVLTIALAILHDAGRLIRKPRSLRQAETAVQVAELRLEEEKVNEQWNELVDRRLHRELTK
jgi:hypothetical protein